MMMSLMSHRYLSLGSLGAFDHLDRAVDPVDVCNRFWAVASELIQDLLE